MPSSVQELDLAQPEFPGGVGRNNVRNLHRTLKDYSVLYFFFTTLSSLLLSEGTIGLLYFLFFFFPILSFYVVSMQSSSMQQHKTYKMPHSLFSQMVKNALVGNHAHIKDYGQE